MFVKRFLNSKRDKKAIVTQLVLPLLMVLFGLLLKTSIPTRENDPPRVLKLSNLSVDEVPTRAFYADFRGKSSDAKQQTLEVVIINTLSQFYLIQSFSVYWNDSNSHSLLDNVIFFVQNPS